MGHEAIRALQLDKVRSQLSRLATGSEFYQQKFSKAGFEPDRVRSLEDVTQVPFTEKAELRDSQADAPPLGLHAAAPMEDILRIHASSGTTGRPSYVGITLRDREIWNEIVSRAYYCEGVRRHDVVIHAFGLGFFVGGLPLKDAVENIGATFVPIGTGASDRVVSSALNLRATILTCTPSYAHYLADYVRERFDMNPAELGFERVLVGGEPGGAVAAVREQISHDFDAEVREGLGNADVAPVFAGTCGHSPEMHFVAPDLLLPELINPDTGETVPWEEGAEGELVITHLERECVPLARFRTRDRIRVAMTPCSCGRTGIRFTCVGRTDDMLIVSGVNIWPSAISDVIRGLRPRTAGPFQILLDAPGPKVVAPLRLQVEYGPEATLLPELKRDLERSIREVLIVRSEVELVPPATLPRFEMKSRLIRRLDEEGRNEAAAETTWLRGSE